MSLKRFIPGTAERIAGKHAAYLRRKVRGHDVLLLVEWDDGQLTELAADYHPEQDGWFEATNGLVFAAVGEGTDTVDYYGVPTVRCHAQIACPISTTAALQAEHDEADEWQYETDADSTERVVKVDTDADPTADRTGDPGNGHGDAATDGGQSVTRTYDIRPPAGAVGHTFSLDQVRQRAPYPVTPNMIRRAVEHGKESERSTGEAIRYVLIGFAMAVALGVIGAVVYISGASILGGGGSTGGSTTSLGYLLALATPSGRAVIDHVRAGVRG